MYANGGPMLHHIVSGIVCSVLVLAPCAIAYVSAGHAETR